MIEKLIQIEQDFIQKQFDENRFTVQQKKKIIEIAMDLKMWGEGDIISIWPQKIKFKEGASYKQKRSGILNEIESSWLKLKNEVKNYAQFKPEYKRREDPLVFVDSDPNNKKIFGRCPVASEKTICCNLMTMDTVQNCDFDCSYCCIQTFYKGNKVKVENNLIEKLKSHDFDKNKTYHIGTGQSSDSLLWGNRGNVLNDLVQFAKDNSNIIFELKTKSNNIKYLLENQIPRNVICTWTLNSKTIIENEEHGTATLEQRLESARALSDKGILVGFHLHPIVYYKGWKEDYSYVISEIKRLFKAHELAMISFGTVTFIKDVVNRIRQRDFKSKILQMPLVDTDGKLSYPSEIKLELFKHIFKELSSFKDDVFLYMCMENRIYWKEIFGYEYKSNEDFEELMKKSYLIAVASISTKISG